LQAGAVNLFCSGGGSKPRAQIKDLPQTRFAKGCSGFAAVLLHSDKMDVWLVDDKGNKLYAFTVPQNA